MMNANREYVDAVADMVKQALELNIPITSDDLCQKINSRLPGKCIPKKIGELDVDAQIRTLDDNKSFNLEYLEDKPKTRILFSLAHELGHLFLHLLENDGTFKKAICHRDLRYNKEEWEANEFAAALLMPEEEFVLKCKEYMNCNIVNITKVAYYFNVSVQAATVRGNVLNLW